MASVLLTDEQFDRMMRAVRYVESLQRGSARGQDVPDTPPSVQTGEVWVKVTGPADEDFKPEDTETDYYPCILTEKFVLSDYEETTYGPLTSYWKDYDAGTADEPEGRCFSLNNTALAEGQRYKATVVDNQDNQYPVLGISDSSGFGIPEYWELPGNQSGSGTIATDFFEAPYAGYYLISVYAKVTEGTGVAQIQTNKIVRNGATNLLVFTMSLSAFESAESSAVQIHYLDTGDTLSWTGTNSGFTTTVVAGSWVQITKVG